MAEGSLNSALLSMRPWPREEKSDSLEVLLPRIHHQYKHFRHVTEQGLKQEIEDLETGTIREDHESSEGELEDSDSKGTLEDVVLRKNKLWNLVSTAHNEGLTLVDMLSLLESGNEAYRRQASQTMSPDLKDKNLHGTLQHRKWESKAPANEVIDESRLITLGLTMQSLTSAADSLLQAATRLEQEVRRQTTYWNGVLEVTEKGWSVFRLAGDRHTLGVQFSAQEASPSFASRGVAALRSNDDGSIKLDRGLTLTPRSIRIRLVNGNRILGQSSTSLSASGGEADSDLEIMIRRARDSLFEEELFYEMVLETRGLLNFGVQYRDQIIHLPAACDANSEERETLLIDLVPLSGTPERDKMPFEDMADGVAMFARVLLLHLFRQRLRKRSEVPKPLSEVQTEDVWQPILKPILAHFQHHQAVRELHGALRAVETILRGAGIPISATTQRQQLLHAWKSAANESKSLDDNTFTLVEALCQPLKSTITFSVPSPSAAKHPTFRASINIHTSFTPTPNAQDQAQGYGTHYELSVPPEISQLMLDLPTTPVAPHAPFSFTTSAELLDYLRFLFAEVIVQNVLSPRLAPAGWRPVARARALVKPIRRNGNVQDAKIEVELADVKLQLRRTTPLTNGKEDAVEWALAENGDQRSVVEVTKAWAADDQT